MTSLPRSIPACATRSAAASPRRAPMRIALRPDRTVTPPEGFVTHLECAATGERVAAGALHGLSPAGKPLLVRYDLERARAALTREAVAARPADMWRWAELSPVRRAADIV